MHVINAISCRLSWEAVKITFKQGADSAVCKVNKQGFVARFRHGTIKSYLDARISGWFRPLMIKILELPQSLDGVLPGGDGVRSQAVVLLNLPLMLSLALELRSKA